MIWKVNKIRRKERKEELVNFVHESTGICN